MKSFSGIVKRYFVITSERNEQECLGYDRPPRPQPAGPRLRSPWPAYPMRYMCGSCVSPEPERRGARQRVASYSGREEQPHRWTIARWAYGQVHRAGGQVWVEARELRPLSDDWRRIMIRGGLTIGYRR